MLQVDRRSFLQGTLMLPLTTTVSNAVEEQPPQSAFIQIGLSDSLITEKMGRAKTLLLVQALSDVFAIPGQPRALMQIDQATQLAKSLSTNRIQLAIMTGIEYSWLEPSFRALLPLVTAFTSDIRMKACILVHADTPVQSLLDLRHQTIALPHRSQFHTRVYLHDAITKLGGNPAGFFDQALQSGNVNDGIERVIVKKADAALVDLDSWKSYQEQMPGRSRRLKILAQSPAFPTAAILHSPGNWKSADLKKMKDVLLSANQKAYTRQILNMFRFSKFIPYSTEYEQVVKDIVREIPRTVTPAAFARRI